MILRPLLIIIYTCILALNVQVVIELARRAARRDLAGKWWAVPVGAWAGRVHFEERA